MRKMLTSGFFDPTLLPNLELYLDARYPLGRDLAAPADGTPLAQWNDLSGKGRHTTQGTASRRPLFRNKNINLLPFAIGSANDTSLLTPEHTQLDAGPARQGAAGITVTHKNRIANSNFELDSIGWSPLDLVLGGVAKRAIKNLSQLNVFPVGQSTVANPVRDGEFLGSHAWTATTVDSGASQGIQGLGWTVGSPFSGGEQITLSIWVKATAGRTMFLNGRLSDSTGGFTASLDSPAVTMTGDWQRISVTGNIGPTIRSASIKILTAGPQTGQTTLTAAAPQIEFGTLTDWSPGRAFSGDYGLSATRGAISTATGLTAGTNYTASAYVFPPATGTYSVHLSGAPATNAAIGPGVRYRKVKNGPGILTEEATVNLCYNPVMATSTAGWWDNGGNAISRVANTGYVGNTALLAQPTRWNTSIISYAIPVTAGSTYTASAYTKGWNETVTQNRIYIRWMDYNNAEISITSTSPNLSVGTDAWQRHVITGTAPAGAVIGQIRINGYNSKTGTDVGWLVDAVQFEEKPYATTFTDGSAGTGYAYNTTTNLVSNGGFETNTAGWSGLNKNLLTPNQSSLETDLTGWGGYGIAGSVSRTTAVAYQGTASLAMSPSAAGNMEARTNGGVGSNEKTHAVIPGQVYTASARFRAATTPRRVKVNISWRDANGGYIINVAGEDFYDNTAGWTQAHVTAQAPANAAFCFVYVQSIGCAAGEVHYVDTIGLFETPTANLFHNSDVENGLVGWTTYGTGTTMARTSDRVYTGRYSVMVTCGTSGQYGGGVHANVTGLTIGKTYTLSSWIYVEPGSEASQPAVRLAGVTSGTTVTTSGAWTRSTLTFVATAETHGVYTAIATGTGTAVGHRFYVDGIQVVAGDTAVPYIPPYTANLVKNPSFEDGMTGWMKYDNNNIGTDSIQTSGGWSGNNFYRITSNGAEANNSLGVRHNAERIWVNKTTYVISFYARAVLDVPNKMALYWNKGPSSIVHISNPNLTTSWQRYAFSVRWDGGMDTVDPNFFVSISARHVGTKSVVTSLDIDAFQIEMGEVPTPFIDGGLTPAHAWDRDENLVANSSFETDASGWEGINKNLLTVNQSSVETDTTGWGPAGDGTATVARSTAAAKHGTASLAITANSNAAQTATSHIPIVPGQVYTATASFRAASLPRTVRVAIVWRRTDNTSPGSVGSNGADNTAGWTTLTTSGQAPADATHAQVYLMVNNAPTGEVHYVDAMGLFETPYANLVINHEFSGSLDPWVRRSLSETIAISRTQSYAGSSSMAITAASTADGVFSDVTAVVGRTYTMSAYVRVPEGMTARIYYYDATQAFVGGESKAGGDVWTRLSVTATAQNTLARIYVRVEAITGGAKTFYMDAPQVVVGTNALPYIVPNTTNLLYNPSLEFDGSGWGTYAGANGGVTVTRVTNMGYASPSSWRVDWTTAPTGSGGAYTNRQYSEIVGGQAYSASMYVRPSKTITMGITIEWYRADGSRVTVSNGPDISCAANTWTRLHIAGAVAPADAVTEVITAYARGASLWAVGDFCYFDAAQLEHGYAVTPYLDGSLGPGYEWVTADNLVPVASSNFDTGTLTGWGVANGTTLSASTEQAVSGTHSMKIEFPTATGVQSGAGFSRTQAANTFYTFSAYIYSPVAVTNLQLSAQGNIAGSGTTTFSHPGGGWRRFTQTYQTNTTGGTVVHYVLLSSPAAGSVLYVDNVQIEQRPFVTPYNYSGVSHRALSTRNTPWVLGGASIENPGTVALGGGYGARALRTSLANNFFGLGPNLPFASGVETRVKVAPNTTYSLSARLAPNGVAPVSLRAVDSANGAVLGVSESYFGSGDIYGVTFTTGPNTSEVRVQYAAREVYYLNNGVNVDGVELEQRPHPTPYGQTGATVNNTSTRQQPWVLGGSSVEALTRVTFNKAFGTASMFVGYNTHWAPISTGFKIGSETVVSVSANTTYTASVSHSAYGGNRTIRAVNAATGEVLGSVTGPQGSAFTRSYVRFSSGTATSVRLQIFNENGDIYIDGVQLEARGYPTPYGEGSHGGVAGYPSSRAKGGVDYNIPALPSTGLSIAGQFTLANTPGSVGFVVQATSTSASHHISIRRTSTGIDAEINYGAGIATASVAAATGDIVSAVATYNGATLTLYASVNGGAVVTRTANTAQTSSNITKFNIGQHFPGTGNLSSNSAVENAMAFNIALSSTDATNLVNGTAAPTTAASWDSCVFSTMVNNNIAATNAPASQWTRLTATQPLGKNTRAEFIVLAPDSVGFSNPVLIDAVQAERANSATVYTEPGVRIQVYNKAHTDVPVSAGKVYSSSFSIKSSVAGRITHADIYWYNSSGGYLGVSPGNAITTTTSWQDVPAAIGQAPANAAFARIGIRVDVLSTTETHDIDNLIIAEVTPAWSLGGTNGNLLTANQSSVETDLTGFGSSAYALNYANTSSPTRTRDTTWSADGAASIRVTANASGQQRVFTTPKVTVSGSETLFLTATVNTGTVPLGKTVYLYLETFRADGSYLNSPVVRSVTVGSQVTELSGQVVTHPDARSAHIMVAYGLVSSPDVMVDAGQYFMVDKMAIIRPQASHAPAWQAPIVLPNGQATVQFDHAALQSLSNGTFSVPGPITAYVIARENGPTTQDYQHVFDSNVGTTRAVFFSRDKAGTPGDSIRWEINAASTLAENGHPYNLSQPAIMTAVYNGTTSAIYRNGVRNALGNAGTQGLNGITVGANHAKNNALNGDIVALLVFSGVHDDATRKRVEKWLSRTYQIPVS